MILRHLRQNIIRSSVDDTHDLSQVIGRQTLLQRTDNRNAACHSRLKHQIAAMLFRRVQHFFSMLRQQILIGRHHMLSSMKCLRNISLRRFDTAHNLDDNLYLRIVQNLLPVVGKKTAVHAFSWLLCIADQNLLQLHHCAKLLRHLILLPLQNVIHTASDSSRAQKRGFDYPYVTHFLFSCL